MKLSILISERGRLPLDERLRLLRQAADIQSVSSSLSSETLDMSPDVAPFLLDVNRFTAAAALRLAAVRRKWILDIGDDPACLARHVHRNPFIPLIKGKVERLMVKHARAIICRGRFHQQILAERTSSPVYWAPDTAPDWLVDAEIAPQNERTVCTFGSMSSSRSGDRAYGWEVVDLVARGRGQLKGIIVGNEPGLTLLRQRAARLGVPKLVEFHPWQPLPELVKTVSSAAFVTSVQTNDSAGWARTTGKLPLALALGKIVIASRVGEASFTLPDEHLVDGTSDDEIVKQMYAIVMRGRPCSWSGQAKVLAEGFRRSKIAKGLADFLGTLS